MRLQHCSFAYANNAQIIQTSKLVNRIKLLDTAISNSNNNQFFLDSKADDEKRSKSDVDTHITPALLNKIMKNIEYFYTIYIENK